jgi:mannose-6-phosphate isomerase-like protein (cupin superfamily)
LITLPDEQPGLLVANRRTEVVKPDHRILHVNEIRVIPRGGGVETVPLVTHASVHGAAFTTGMSVYPVGTGAPMHRHNVDEQVTLLEGEGEVEIDGKVTPLSRYDSTYIRGGQEHCFRNTGNTPMRILWIYASGRVTRTFAGSDEEVEHLSVRDLMG